MSIFATLCMAVSENCELIDVICVDALQFLCSMQRIFACENLLLLLKTLKVNEFFLLGKQGRRNQVYYQQCLLCAN